MTTQRERFEAFAAADTSGLTDADLTVARHFWREAERQMIERCAEVCDEKAAHAILCGGAQNCANTAQMLADDIRALGDENVTPMPASKEG